MPSDHARTFNAIRRRQHQDNRPGSVELVCPAGLQLGAADADGKKIPAFAMVAYTGAPIQVSAWFDPVVIDLGGVKLPTQAVAIRRNHDPSRTVGHSTAVAITDGQITAEGVLSFETADAQEIVAASRNGFPWQASVGMAADRVEFIAEGKSTEVNGRMVDGPIDVIRSSTLREISFVDLGADSGTSASVAASHQERQMAKREQKVTPQVEGGAEDMDTVEGADAMAEIHASNEVKDQKPAKPDLVRAMREEAAAEVDRIAKVRDIAKGQPEIEAKAIREGWDLTKTELECLRAARPSAPAVHTSGGGPIEASVIEAAVCLAGNLPNREKKFEPKTLEAAHKTFRRGLGLQELIEICARANGWSGRTVRSDLEAAFRAACPRTLEAGFSTLSLTGILGNTANKFLLEGFMAVDRAFVDISSTKNVRDFKTNTSYRLNGGFEYEELAPDGEISHGTVSETSYTNQAKTYARMFAITRTDIINDDLGALSDVPMRLGRGAAIKLNKVFWTEFMNNSSFFTTGNGNYFEGAATNLQQSSLVTALALFRNQTDPDGNPIGVEPKILLVPPALEVTANNIFNSNEVRDTTAAVKFETKNPFQGRFRPVVTPYLSNSTITGNSTTAWYLLADPAQLSTIEVAYLNGVQEPTVESADADFNTLGIQMRGYHDFGVTKQEYRAGVKSKGAA